MYRYEYGVAKPGPVDLDAKSDRGPIEAAYLTAVAFFAENAGVTELAIREPAVGAEATIPGHGLDGLFPRDLTGFHDGAQVSIETAQALVRAMLRDDGAWCELEVEDRFSVLVLPGQCLLINTVERCPDAVTRTNALGLVAEEYDFNWFPEEEPEPRPADDAFWAEVAELINERGSVHLEEIGVVNASRRHVLRPGDVEGLRLTPRARLVVRADDDEPLLTAVLPDDDGVVRSRWRP